MSEKKQIAAIYMITDTENSVDNIGDIEGAFPENWLYDHIEKYGAEGLMKTLCFMNWQIFSTIRKVNSDRSFGEACKQND